MNTTASVQVPSTTSMTTPIPASPRRAAEPTKPAMLALPRSTMAIPTLPRMGLTNTDRSHIDTTPQSTVSTNTQSAKTAGGVADAEQSYSAEGAPLSRLQTMSLSSNSSVGATAAAQPHHNASFPGSHMPGGVATLALPSPASPSSTPSSGVPNSHPQRSAQTLQLPTIPVIPSVQAASSRSSSASSLSTPVEGQGMWNASFSPAIPPNLSTQQSPLAPNASPQEATRFLRPGVPMGRQRIDQACEKCRERKAKCNGGRPSCQRCLSRGLNCVYAAERRMRGPNKDKRPPKKTAAKVSVGGKAPNLSREASTNDGTASDSPSPQSLSGTTVVSTGQGGPPSYSSRDPTFIPSVCKPPVEEDGPSPQVSSVKMDAAGGGQGAIPFITSFAQAQSQLPSPLTPAGDHRQGGRSPALSVQAPAPHVSSTNTLSYRPQLGLAVPNLPNMPFNTNGPQQHVSSHGNQHASSQSLHTRPLHFPYPSPTYQQQQPHFSVDLSAARNPFTYSMPQFALQGMPSQRMATGQSYAGAYAELASPKARLGLSQSYFDAVSDTQGHSHTPSEGSGKGFADSPHSQYNYPSVMTASQQTPNSVSPASYHEPAPVASGEYGASHGPSSASYQASYLMHPQYYGEDGSADDGAEQSDEGVDGHDASSLMN